jgi:hypothetical protein
VVIQRHAIGVFERYPFARGEIVFLLIQLSDLCFGEVVICRLQKTNVQSGEAVVVTRNLQPDQLDEFRLNRSAFTGRTIKLEVAVEHFLTMGESSQV